MSSTRLGREARRSGPWCCSGWCKQCCLRQQADASAGDPVAGKKLSLGRGLHRCFAAALFAKVPWRAPPAVLVPLTGCVRSVRVRVRRVVERSCPRHPRRPSAPERRPSGKSSRRRSCRRPRQRPWAVAQGARQRHAGLRLPLCSQRCRSASSVKRIHRCRKKQ